MDANVSVKATSTQKTHTLSVAVVGSGAGSVACSINGGLYVDCGGAIPEGAEVKVKVVAAKGSGFLGFKEGTASATVCSTAPLTNPCVIEHLEADSTLKAEVAENMHTIAVSLAGAGTGTVECKVDSGAFGSCEGPIGEGSKVEIKATADSHSTFAGFSAGSGSAAGCSASPCVISSLEADDALTANFALKSYQLAITPAGTGTGSVSCNGAPCAPSYPFGAKVALSASAAAGSTFAGFSGAGCSGTSCTLTIEADTAVTATFDANPPPDCVVPKLVGKSLAAAKAALRAAHCALGKVTKPRARKGKRLGALVVKSSQPAAGRVLAENSKVNLRLGPKPKKRGRH
jgi:hypothetical protein